jgi:hypothetical protein
MDRHQRIREEFRHHYFIRHGIKLDDEVLMILIRLSQMHRDLRKEIRQMPRVQFRNQRDYFYYGIGRMTGVAIAVLLLLILLLLFRK